MANIVPASSLAATGNDNRELQTIEGFAQHAIKSGMFGDVRDMSKAVVKIKLGQTLGLDPMASLKELYIQNGKLQMSAVLMARLIKASKKYRYTVDENSEKQCVIQVYEKVDSPSGGWEWFAHKPVVRTADDYKHLLNKPGPWKEYRKDMLFSRTISVTARMVCPDVFGGNAVYTPDEIADNDPESPISPDPYYQRPADLPPSFTSSSATSSSTMMAEGEIEVQEFDSEVVANEEEVAGLRAAIEANGLDLKWARLTLLSPKLEWSNLSPDELVKLRNELDKKLAKVKGGSK